MQPIELTYLNELNLDNHLVIEASAGTGKTYTIEHIVSNLLIQSKVTSLDQVLIVTFTDKAASELKERIRKNIEACYYKNRELSILRESLENFEQASIFTIHGLCNRIIQQYAFENNGHFSNELVPDQQIYRKILHANMKNKWPLLLGDIFEPLLIISGFPDTRGGVSEWENRVIKLATRFNQHFDQVIPEVPQNMHEYAALHFNKLGSSLQSLLDTCGHLDKKNILDCGLYKKYASLNIKGNSLGAKLKIIHSLLAFLADYCEHNTFNSASLSALLFFLKNTSHKNGYHTLNDHWKKEGPDYDSKLPELPAIIELLEQIKSLVVNDLQFQFLAFAVTDLNQEAIAHKRSLGFISYDDMISQVYESIITPGNSLQQSLQKKYFYAIVDEFQDTDMLQWHILRAIFLDKNNVHTMQHRLFIIGDPKQAIYSFRGADINAYYSAKEEMLNNYNAGYYSLSNNWRSTRELIGSFNLLLAGKNWFSDDNINYIPNSFPEQKQLQAEHGPAVTIIELDECTGAIAASRMAAGIALEIKQLLTNTDMTAADISILIRKWPEADYIEKALRHHAIPYCFYKKEGLYQSTEAFHLFYVLNSIAFASDIMTLKKALLTDFFLIPSENIITYEHIPASHPIRMLYNKWVLFASQRKWAELFQSLIDDTHLLKDITEQDNWERKLANYRQIIQHLEVMAFSNGFDIFDIIHYLRDVINMTISDDALNIEKIGTDEPKVQIMTIHASKGLEFKVVFIAGGYTQKQDNWYTVSHQNNKRIINLFPLDDCGADESELEEERLFYVALTRAKNRLYLPRYRPGKHSRPGFIGTKLNNALAALENHSALACISYAEIKDVSFDPAQSIPVSSNLHNFLFQEIHGDFQSRRLFVDSFSSIKHKKELGATSYNDARSPQPGDDDYNEHGPDFDGPIAGLPHGKETGSLLHEIFEEIDFSIAGETSAPEELLAIPAIDSLIHEKIAVYLQESTETFINSCKKEAASIVWHTLHASLGAHGPALKDVQRKIHEMEFYFPSGNDEFIHGYIDLVFEYNNAYYILDWKSNYLADGYSPDQLEKNIFASHYDVQFTIYSFALVQWLKRYIPGYNFAKHFGGIYYLYIRGMDINKPGEGVYFFKPESEEEITGKVTSVLSLNTYQ